MRDAAARWMPVLMRVGATLRDLVDAPPTLLAGGLKARISAARIRPDGVTVYDIAVSAGAEAWTVTKRYSEMRAAAGVSSGPLACAMDDGFPARSVGGTARKQALDAWLRAAAKACTTERAARMLYPVLGATPARVDAAAADLAAGAELRATIPFAAAGFAARLRQSAQLRAALKRTKPSKPALRARRRVRGGALRAAALPPERVAAPRAVLFLFSRLRGAADGRRVGAGVGARGRL